MNIDQSALRNILTTKAFPDLLRTENISIRVSVLEDDKYSGILPVKNVWEQTMCYFKCFTSFQSASYFPQPYTLFKVK